MHVALLLHRYCLRSFAHTVYKTSPSFLRALNSHKASQNSEGSVLVEVIFGANLTRPCCAHIFRLMAAKFDEQRSASSFVFAHGSEINHCCNRLSLEQLCRCGRVLSPPTRHFCSAACAQCLSTAHALRSWHLPILSNGLHGGAQGTHWCYPPLCDEASWSTSGCAMCRQFLIEITEAAEA